MEKKYQLPKEFTEKWIKALRSGVYSQGACRLKDDKGGYCCLGVAGAIVGISEFNDKQFYNGSVYSLSVDEDLIPPELWGSGDNDLVGFLTEMNDSNISFSTIADWIEENVELI